MSRPPTVLFVSHWDWVLHHFRVPIADALRDAGAGVTMVCPDGPYVARLRDLGYRCLEWKVDRRGMNPVAEARSFASLLSLYRAERPDLVHHFTIKPVLYGSLATRFVRVPLVVNTLSGLGYLFSEDRRARMARTAVMPILRRALRPGRLILQNDDDYDLLARAGALVAEHTVVIRGSGVDLEKFRRPESAPTGPPTVVMAARLLHDKGVADFVEAARRLKDDGSPARFVLAGAPDPGSPGTISDEQIARWRSLGVVDFLGDCEDMAELLRAADVAVLPTRYREGVPRFLLEAAATGLPAVTTDGPGCRIAVRDGLTGYIVDPGDVQGLTARLAELLAAPDLRASMGYRARELAEAEFSQDAVVRAHMDLYLALGFPPQSAASAR